jgi:hypothetical protein
VLHTTKLVTVGVALALSSLAGDGRSQTESPPALANWTPLGQVFIDKSGCASCPATFATSRRHRAFGVASDSPFPVSLAGRIDVICEEGTTYSAYLRSPLSDGLFQIVPNACVNLESKEIQLTVTFVGLAPPDAARKVALIVYGSFG